MVPQHFIMSKENIWLEVEQSLRNSKWAIVCQRLDRFDARAPVTQPFARLVVALIRKHRSS